MAVAATRIPTEPDHRAMRVYPLQEGTSTVMRSCHEGNFGPGRKRFTRSWPLVPDEVEPFPCLEWFRNFLESERCRSARRRELARWAMNPHLEAHTGKLSPGPVEVGHNHVRHSGAARGLAGRKAGCTPMERQACKSYRRESQSDSEDVPTC